jgi:site-specific DNA-methyltransferase (adenine-specific)
MVWGIEEAGYDIRDTVMWLVGTGFPKNHNVGRKLGGEWDGWGTALKPAWEPIILARKPLIGSVAANVTAYGTGALNIDGCRIELDGDYKSQPNGRPSLTSLGDNYDPMKANKADTVGRWPANVVLDEDAAALLDAQSGESRSTVGKPRRSQQPGNGYGMTFTGSEYDDTGGASRFFYVAKASSAERNRGLAGLPERRVDPVNHTDQRVWDIPGSHATPRANHHPTVKPIALMQWLCRLVTPPGGTVLDPFMGSGSTLIAASREGFSAVGIELDPEYAEIARRRIQADCPMFADVAVA